MLFPWQVYMANIYTECFDIYPSIISQCVQLMLTVFPLQVQIFVKEVHFCMREINILILISIRQVHESAKT
jgi:hypothetical protein